MNGRIARVVVGALLVGTGLVVVPGGSLPVGAAEVTTTVAYTGPPVVIVDAVGAVPGPPATAGIDVTGLEGEVIDVDLLIGGGPVCDASPGSVTAGINHTHVADLDLTLVAPDGTEVLVADNAGDFGINFCQSLFDDDAGAQNIQTALFAQDPFDGTWTPANALSAFDGLADANGTWTLQAQDFVDFQGGAIRAFSVIITTVTTSNLSATKTVGGDFVEGGEVTYEVALTNGGNGDSIDNPGDEFVDVLPDGLELLSATADAGMIDSDLTTDTVAWNGAIAAGATVTVTIDATVAAGTGGSAISNQGTVSFDADANGTNETSVLTDAVAGGTLDPTTFTVAAAQATTTTTSTPTAPSTTPTTAAVNSGTIPQTGGASTLSQVSVALGLILIGFGLVLLGTRTPQGTRPTQQ